MGRKKKQATEEIIRPCNKAAFETKELAKKRIDEIWKSSAGGTGHKPTRAYKCDYCKKFHLTHKSEFSYKKSLRWKGLSPEEAKAIRKENLVNREAEYWKGKLGIED